MRSRIIFLLVSSTILCVQTTVADVAGSTKFQSLLQFTKITSDSVEVRWPCHNRSQVKVRLDSFGGNTCRSCSNGESVTFEPKTESDCRKNFSELCPGSRNEVVVNVTNLGIVYTDYFYTLPVGVPPVESIGAVDVTYEELTLIWSEPSCSSYLPYVYNVHLRGGPSIKNITGNTMRVPDLKMNQTYGFAVEACVRGTVPCSTSKEFLFRTKDGLASVPRNLQARGYSPTDLMVSWDLPLVLGPKFNYQLQVAQPGLPYEFGAVLAANARGVLAHSLQPHTLYEVRLLTLSYLDKSAVEGEVTSVHARTLPDVPGRARISSVTATSENTLEIKWEKPADPNGPIDAYRILVSTEATEVVSQRLPGTSNSMTTKALRPYTDYNVTLVAINIVEEKELTGSADVMSVTTLPGTPSAPKIKVTPDGAISQNKIKIEWLPPEEPNGPVDGYRVTYALKNRMEDDPDVPGKVIIHTDLTSHEATGLLPYRKYAFSVATYHIVSQRTGLGRYGKESEVVEIATKAGAVVAVKNVRILVNENGYINVTWERVVPMTGTTPHKVLLLRSNRKVESDERCFIGQETVSWQRGQSLGWDVHTWSYRNWTEGYCYVAQVTVGLDSLAVSNITRLAGKIYFNPEAPVDLEITSTAETSLSIKWKEPLSPKNKTFSYRVKCGTRPNEGQPLMADDSNKTVHQFQGLEPYTRYYISVVALYEQDGRNVTGETAQIAHRTLSAPSSKPRNVSVKALSWSQLLVTWERPEKANGPIDAYVFNYVLKDTSMNKIWTVFDPYATSTVLPVPKPYQLVKVRLQAMHKIGTEEIPGEEFLYPNYVRTLASSPHLVSSLETSEATNTSLKLSWGPPVPANGPIDGYLLTVDGPLNNQQGDPKREIKELSVAGSKTELLLTRLVPGKKYKVSIKAFNEVNGVKLYGKETELTPETASAIPGKASQVQLKLMETGLMEVNWNPPVPATGPTEYIIHIESSQATTSKDCGTSWTLSHTKHINGWENNKAKFQTWSVQRCLRALVVAKTATGETPSDPSPTLFSGSRKPIPSEPQDVVALSDLPDEIAVNWREPLYPNGQNLTYWVSIVDTSDGDDQREVKAHSDSHHVFNSVNGHALYLVTVRAALLLPDGQMVYGLPGVGRVLTHPKAPGVPRLASKSAGSTSVVIRWEIPEHPNAPDLEYRVDLYEFKRAPELVRSNTTKAKKLEFEDLKGAAVYRFTVSATDGKGGLQGKSLIGFFKTGDGAGPPLPIKTLTAVTIGETWLDFFVPDHVISSQSGDIIDFPVIVGKQELISSAPGHGGEKEEIKESWSHKLELYRASHIGWTPYGTEDDPFQCKFHLLEEKTPGRLCRLGAEGEQNCKTSQFCNGPLLRGTPYGMKIRGSNKAGWSETQALYFTTGGGGVPQASILLLLSVIITSKWRN